MDYSQRKVGRAFARMVDSVESYCDAYKQNWGDTPIGDDGYASDPMVDILKALRHLLSAEIGELDGGTMDRRIRAIAKAHGMLSDNGEIES